jgi:hypothetical protein
MLSPAAKEAIEFLRRELRVEVTTKKEGGRSYMDGVPAVVVKVALFLEDEQICEDSSTVHLE